MWHKIKVLTNVMLDIIKGDVGTIIYDISTKYHNCDEGTIIFDISTIKCDADTINMMFWRYGTHVGTVEWPVNKIECLQIYWSSMEVVSKLILWSMPKDIINLLFH